MKIEELQNKLIGIGVSNLNYDKILNKINVEKRKFVTLNKQEEAKSLWIYEQIFKIHKKYKMTFALLKNKKYYAAWCELEQIEIIINNLKRHFNYDEFKYKLHFVEKTIVNLQTIYPYRVFSSTELLIKEVKCSTCGQIISIRKSCGHQIGEIYEGDMCYRIVNKFELLGIAIVENPEHKYAVLFAEKDSEDCIGYDAIKYLMNFIENPYEDWNLLIKYNRIPHENFVQSKHEELCPCGNSKSYQNCCLNEKGVLSTEFEFILKQETAKRLIKEKKIIIERT